MEPNAWWDVVADIVGETHRASGPDLGRVADHAMRRLGMAAELYLADHGQRVLTPITAEGRAPIAIEGTLAGRAFQLQEPTWAPTRGPATELWVPMVDGTERIGAVRFGLPDDLSPWDVEVRERCIALADLLGHIVASKFAYGDALHVARRTTPFTPDAELLWQLLPPLTFASEDIMISVVLEPYQRVGGDAFDYAVDERNAFCALFDSVGHDMQSGLTTAVALAAIRNARRGGVRDLGELAGTADRLIIENRPVGTRYVTAILSWLDLGTGELTYVLAGHPPPLLLRANSAVKQLRVRPRIPLGISDRPIAAATGREHLEPGDRLLFFTDGIVESRDDEGRPFGFQRLVEFIERDSAANLAAPETLRRVMHAVLDYQWGRIDDDATLMMIDWRPPTETLPPETSAPRHDT
ncbi:Stage II sporulation protein E (SpoIIE) [Saccharomonospora glauca K62]|uniref:Stage II sporulation protein E (SpoIIE) n=1 Tax=Saccharomonospora glauca K62 TaxID=928724 RepID=I1D0K8_9PSEU|nr:Stage II sporulation protein E (SpoIIE) [Saccharomonospora glauca K62]